MTNVSIDLLKATIKDLQHLLETKRCNSVDLVEAYLAAIEKDNYNGLKLHAVIETSPKETLMRIAKEFDHQRESGKPLGALHGIPLLVKDVINTHPELGMKTTAGSFALNDAIVKDDAEVIKRLRQAGAIILGKSNLSEWASYRQEGNVDEGSEGGWRNMRSNGWSARGGACVSAYNPQRNPLGSSTGSTVGVSAGFAPAALGTETLGSICAPASVAGLYSMKPTPGSIDLTGVIGFVPARASIGPITKCAYDTALLIQVMAGDSGGHPGEKRDTNYIRHTLNPTFNGKKLGFYPWQADSDATEQETEYKRHLISKATTTLRTHGATVIPETDIEPIIFDEAKWHRLDDMTSYTEIKASLKEYFEGLEKTRVRSLEDVIQFNIDNKDIEMPPSQPGQAMLFKAQAAKGRDKKEFIEGSKELEKMSGEEGLAKLFDKYDLDAVVSTIADHSTVPIVLASAAKYPIATVPLGFDETLQEPISLYIVGRPFSEGLLVELMAAWENVFPERRVPPVLEAAHRKSK